MTEAARREIESMFEALQEGPMVLGLDPGSDESFGVLSTVRYRPDGTMEFLKIARITPASLDQEPIEE